MKQYLQLLKDVLEFGETRQDRTGTGTLSIFGYQARYSMEDGFPLVTTKKCHLRSIIHELLWFLKGDTNIKYLNDNRVTIWDEWADKNGDLGPVYGFQWRHWGEKWAPGFVEHDGVKRSGASRENSENFVDQIAQVIESIKTNPYSRRHIVSAWNVSEIENMALPPCHTMFQFYVHEDKRLSCQLYQRSADIFLGVPFNIASYALLTMMIAQVTGLKPGTFVHTMGDAHLYSNHIEQAKTQLERSPKPKPRMLLNPNVKHIDDFVFEDFTLEDYSPYPTIKAPISV